MSPFLACLPLDLHTGLHRSTSTLSMSESWGHQQVMYDAGMRKSKGSAWTAGTSSKNAARMEKSKQAVAAKLGVKKNSGVVKKSKAAAGKATAVASKAAKEVAAAATEAATTVKGAAANAATTAQGTAATVKGAAATVGTAAQAAATTAKDSAAAVVQAVQKVSCPDDYLMWNEYGSCSTACKPLLKAQSPSVLCCDWLCCSLHVCIKLAKPCHRCSLKSLKMLFSP